MEYCTNPSILKIILLIKTILKTIIYIIPIILIIIIIIDFSKATMGDEKDLNKAISISVKRIISAIIIFFVPTIVNAIFSLVSNNSTSILDCYTNATSKKIEHYVTLNAENLVANVKKTLDLDDYNAALSAINKVKDKEEQAEVAQKYLALKEELEALKETVNLNYEISNLRFEVNKIKDYYNENDYKNLYNKISNLKDNNVKQELLAILNQAKKEYDDAHNPYKPLNIETGLHERSDYDSEMRYIEVIPDGVTTNMPMIIYLHGIWSYGSFSTKAPNYLITNYVKSGEAYKDEKFIFIVPRIVLSQGNEYGSVTWQTSQGVEQSKKLKGLIDFLINKYSIDSKRIIITGVSLGGDGAWAMVEYYPNLFAGSVPISGCASNNPNISNYLRTPIIAYHGTGYNEDDYKVCVPSIYKKIKNAGGNIELRKKDGYSHGDMQKVYIENDGEIFSWMLKQKK